MSAIPCLVSSFTKCSSDKSNQEANKYKHNDVRFKRTNKIFSSANVDTLSQDHHDKASFAENVHLVKEQIPQNIPKKKQLVDPDRQGMFVNGGLEYRQTFVIRSSEVGTDRTMTIESILNLLQETSLNYAWLSGLMNGYGTTFGMKKNNLMWVVSRLQVQVDHYPLWGEVIEIDTWVGSSGKNGMRRDWILRGRATGLVFARATSTWAMMNKHTRRLSKMPDEVRDEISPLFIEKQAIKRSCEGIQKLNSNASYVNSDIKPKRSDLDMNHHVNYVTYVKWMIEAIPDEFLQNHQLSNITLEYKRECGRSDVVQSLCEPQENQMLKNGNSFSSHDKLLEGNGRLGSFDHLFSYTHLLHMKGDPEKGEILRAKTTWKDKLTAIPFRN